MHGGASTVDRCAQADGKEPWDVPPDLRVLVVDNLPPWPALGCA